MWSVTSLTKSMTELEYSVANYLKLAVFACVLIQFHCATARKHYNPSYRASARAGGCLATFSELNDVEIFWYKKFL